MAHQARKRFGQHFLCDEAVIERIVRAIAPQADDIVVEIGPGLSALTQPLLNKLNHLTVVEIDRDLAERLRSSWPQAQLSIVQADALHVNFSELGKSLRIVGNLPYNISTPLLFHLADFSHLVIDQHFMLQREVVHRLVAKPGSSDFGRLSVMLQARYRIEKLFDVGPESFEPPPKVMSSVVRMIPLPESRLQPKSQQAFEKIVAQAFSQRRKMLRRVLADWSDSINWDALEIEPTARAETMSVAQFIALSDQLFQAGKLPKNQ